MANVFISYRREDSGGHAGRLYDRLTARFGNARVFMDLQDIAPDVLRHRLVLSYDALADEIAPDTIVERVLETVPLPTVVE